MGSPIRQLIANLFMAEFEVKPISSCLPPDLWLRYVEDTFVIQQARTLSTVPPVRQLPRPHFQFTNKDPHENGSILFLDTLVSRNTLSTTVYHKPTHTDQLPTLGQQPLHCSQTQHVQHLNTLYMSSVYRPTCFLTGEIPHQTGAPQMQFPPWA